MGRSVADGCGCWLLAVFTSMALQRLFHGTFMSLSWHFYGTSRALQQKRRKKCIGASIRVGRVSPVCGISTVVFVCFLYTTLLLRKWKLDCRALPALQKSWYPILDTRISGRPLSLVTLVLPSLYSETGLTEKLWSNCVLIILENQENSVFPANFNFFNFFFYLKRFFQIFQDFRIFRPFLTIFGFFVVFL